MPQLSKLKMFFFLCFFLYLFMLVLINSYFNVEMSNSVNLSDFKMKKYWE